MNRLWELDCGFLACDRFNPKSNIGVALRTGEMAPARLLS